MGTMEISSNPEKNNSEKGGLRTMPFIIANESFEKVASIGLQANMVMYLKNEYHLDNASGASIMFLWGAVSNFMPTFGAFLSDSYFGRFRVIASGTIVSLLGITLLWLTALLPSVRPPSCDITIQTCSKPNKSQLLLLFTSFAIMSIGAGGIRPCSLAFGADQFDNPDNPKNERTLQSFFNWYYASVGISVMISVTVIVYIQTEFGWIVGFGVPVGLMLLSAIFFLVGSKLYIKVEANKSLLTGFSQVIAVAYKNKHLAYPPNDSNGWYHHGNDSSKMVMPTEKLRFLNKACIIRNPEKDLNPDGSASQPFNLCTIEQVENLKSIIKVLPIWSTGIMIAATISQHSFPVYQALTMDRHFFSSSFKIPAGSFSVFGILTLTIWVAIYDQIIVPFLSKYTKEQRGLSLKQRMGIGLILSCLAMSVSALVERTRRARAINEGLANNGYAVIQMSAMWLVPQHCISGLAEAFNAIGQIEFYYSQFPQSMASIGVALFALGMAVGNLVGSLIVGLINDFSKKGGNESWVSSNLNKGHYDYYYWVLAILSVVNFFYFILCSWAYGGCEKQKVWDYREGLKDEEEMQKENESPMRDVILLKGSPIIIHTP